MAPSSRPRSKKSSMALSSRPRSKKSGNSSPLPVVCVVMEFPCKGEYGLLMTNLNGGGSNGGFFEPRFPQVRFVDFGRLWFCAVDSMLYLIDECSSVYTLKLSEKFLGLQDCEFDKSELGRAPPLKSSKSFPILIRYKKYIVVCSTKIYFADMRKDDTFEFEVYDIDGKMSRILPPLLILAEVCTYPSEPCSYELYDRKCGRVTATFTGSLTEDPDAFNLGGVSIVNKHTLIVQTEMGTIFSLDLQSPYEEGWKVWDEGWLVKHSSPFSVIQNRICISSLGAYDMTIRDADSKFKLWHSFNADCWYQSSRFDIDMKRKFRRDKVWYDVIKSLDEVNRSLPFPESPIDELVGDFYEYQCEYAAVGDCDYVLTQMVTEATTHCTHFTIDVLKLDPSKFPKLNYWKFREKQQELHQSCGRNQKWAKVVKSFNFVMPRLCYGVHIKCVLPLRI